ncbi:2-dehydro-3-deoxygalactonokinase [uncultured Microbulbifer sp.]|uniref:2-dehydro-3-deoxygalactonokinase n=1 Tax=uncultured Microbulbifer sp. TaxID=348147 RepID=UPI002633C316|nr:2-dehydro-3-deoxygalactonokinase [uncultured Microbulbifer sp.]
MNEILACDWGTSSFRLMHLGSNGEIIREIATGDGIKNLSRPVMEEHLVSQVEKLDAPAGTPVILCGMVGSTIGWQEAPYTDCPVSIGGLAQSLSAMPGTRITAYCVPGVKLVVDSGAASGGADVMRGEETQVIGWLTQASDEEKEKSTLCLPGTHSKWVHIQNGAICDFSTAFTGELFALLSDHSVLVQGEQRVSEPAFFAGLQAAAASSGLIHQLFSARSRSVLGVQSPSASASYLSGLLVGSEVAAMASELPSGATVHLVCGDHLVGPYGKALEHFGLRFRHYPGSTYSAHGLWAIAKASGLMC